MGSSTWRNGHCHLRISMNLFLYFFCSSLLQVECFDEIILTSIKTRRSFCDLILKIVCKCDAYRELSPRLIMSGSHPPKSWLEFMAWSRAAFSFPFATISRYYSLFFFIVYICKYSRNSLLGLSSSLTGNFYWIYLI